VGEGKGIGFAKPPVTRALAGRIRELGAKPFLTGSATLYRGRRANAVDHIEQAYDHGFTPDGIGCPIVMCDGLRGSDQISVTVPGARRCKSAFIGSAVAAMDGLAVVTHPTGHPGAGFGAALKNVSMGLASRGGKMGMHHESHPIFDANKCTACGRCAKWCPADAIAIEETSVLQQDNCIGCGECLAVCPSNAIDFKWSVAGNDFQERLVDYCGAARELLGERILFINVVQHYQKGCDCFGTVQEAICPDVGILVSRDMVAIDTATADLVCEAAGHDLVREAGGLAYRDMLAYAEELGLGTREYELVEGGASSA
jgi:uncharacterized Fe-S center protein